LRRRNEQVDWRQGKPVFIAIGILIACSLLIGVAGLLLMPREASMAPTVDCLDNLKRLTTAARAYATDHENLLPPVTKMTPAADVARGKVTYPPDVIKLWPQNDWRRLLLRYVDGPTIFLCPVTQSAFSYQLNSTAHGLDPTVITGQADFALLWDVGLREQPGQGPHAGKYAVNTLGGTGFATTGNDELSARLRFAP
jgi:hypothetical protein